jgi:hypothetical protein
MELTIEEIKELYPEVETKGIAEEEIMNAQNALARVEATLAGGKVQGKAKTRIELMIKHYTDQIAELKRLADTLPVSGGKGTRRKRRSQKKWTSSATRKRSSMSASKARRART